MTGVKNKASYLSAFVSLSIGDLLAFLHFKNFDFRFSACTDFHQCRITSNKEGYFHELSPKDIFEPFWFWVGLFCRLKS